MQGFNMGRYYPPDASNPPSFNQSSHPLGKRANKLSQGILTVRFELPFAVWCDHCNPSAIVGQGVRFNAEKKKVGSYYSTPIWSFRMKHSACGGWWEIRTDPKNAEYVVVDGAKRREYGPEDKLLPAEGEMRFLTEEEKEKRRNDVFANLEGKLEDKGNELKNKERVEELYDQSEVWRDPYEVNARLRNDFRGKRKAWKLQEQKNEDIQDKFSLGIDIADEADSDRLRASVVDFGSNNGNEVSLSTANWRPIFDSHEEEDRTGSTSTSSRTNSATDKSRCRLQKTLVANSRFAVDPFLSENKFGKAKPHCNTLKRKRSISQGKDTHNTTVTHVNITKTAVSTQEYSKKPIPALVLVNYESD